VVVDCEYVVEEGTVTDDVERFPRVRPMAEETSRNVCVRMVVAGKAMWICPWGA
jgi:hypothetical protein